jgi:beta-mannosidase
VRLALPADWTLRVADPSSATPDAHLPVPNSAVPHHVSGRSIPARVPGSVHTDLLAAGLITDPYLTDAEDRLRWIGHTDWRYSTIFHAEELRVGERADLVFEGLDTIATISLNGSELARTANMHRSYRFDVRAHLVAGDNQLVVTFDAPIEAAQRRSEELGPRPHVNSFPYNAIRKMACNYGWDWGPELVTSGIWKSVFLDRWETVRIAALRPLVTVDQGPTGAEPAGVGQGEVALHVDLEWADGAEPAELSAEVAGSYANTSIRSGQPSVVLTVDVPDPQLWWPHGYGQQPLYPLEVVLSAGGRERDRRHHDIGFRSVTVDTAPDDIGSSFTLRINGRPIFAAGANWIPDDCFPHRIGPDRYARRVDQAVEAGINLLRVWGGGLYESEDFYAACDRAGVLVWQDFLFACAAYSEQEPLRGEVIAEAREAVTRLVSHPSLAIWNGGNENIWAYWDWGWKEKLGDLGWGIDYYQEVLPAIVAELDPTRPYCPGSPFSPSPTVHPNDPTTGSMHIWDVWNQRDYTGYADYVPRFLSEFGWQGPPTWATLRRAIDPDQMAADSPQMLLHQKAEDGNDKLARGLAPHLPAPSNFSDWHWANSLNQARAVQFGIEHFRSFGSRCAGTVVWQLNDCWPVTSWAAIDGDGRRKPLFYALAHAYRARLLTVQPRPDGLAVVVVNNTDDPWQDSLSARRLDLKGVEINSQHQQIDVAPRSSATVMLHETVGVPGHAAGELLQVSAGAVQGWHFFVQDKDSELPPPELRGAVTAVPGGYRVEVTATTLLKDLALLADKIDPAAEVDDQLVTLLPGESAVFLVRTTATLDPESLLGSEVLRSANQLLHP